jgi:hypothetical protein
MDATATPAPDAPGATLATRRRLPDPAVAARVRHVAEPANAENLDRLAAVPAGQAP